jgi:hypothetical protein
MTTMQGAGGAGRGGGCVCEFPGIGGYAIEPSSDPRALSTNGGRDFRAVLSRDSRARDPDYVRHEKTGARIIALVDLRAA